MKKNFILLIILIVLAGGAGFMAFYQSNGTSSIAGDPLKNFAIADTAAISKIVIYDKQSDKTATLERVEGQRLWALNGQHQAKFASMELILKTIKNMEVRSETLPTMKNFVFSTMAVSGKKVDVYINGELDRTYLVGPNTQKHNGTFMLLETPEDGRSPEPFIVKMAGFHGFLNTRFHADEGLWRYTGIFNYPTLDISQIEVTNHRLPQESFVIDYKGGNDVSITQKGHAQPAPNASLAALKDYMLNFRQVHCEYFAVNMIPTMQDSIRAAQAEFTFRVTGNSGESKAIDVHQIRLPNTSYDMTGDLMEFDGDNMYGLSEGMDIMSIQTFSFGPMMRNFSDFIAQKPS